MVLCIIFRLYTRYHISYSMQMYLYYNGRLEIYQSGEGRVRAIFSISTLGGVGWFLRKFNMSKRKNNTPDRWWGMR